MAINRWVILIFSYTAFGAFLSLYLLLAKNEYSWMLELDSQIALPVDEDVYFKAILFGFPAITLLFFILYYSFRKFGTIPRVVAFACFVSGFLLIVSNYPNLAI